MKLVASAFPTFNDPYAVQIAKKAANSLNGDFELMEQGPIVVSDDISFYLEKIKGAFGLFGVGYEHHVNYPNHHASFDLDENALTYGTAWYLSIAYEYLKKK